MIQKRHNEKEEPLRIQIVSDLHIEFYDKNRKQFKQALNKIEPKAPVLALLGDIGYACSEQLRQFLFIQADRFEVVLFVAGNHEYYNNNKSCYSMTEQNEWLKSICAEQDNLHFMEKDSIIINGVLILATTLWSEIPDDVIREAETSMNDYNLIYNHEPGEKVRLLTATESRDMHRESLAWLRSQLADVKKKKRSLNDGQQYQKVVVLTHHTPLLSGTSHPQYDGSKLNHCFSTNLESLIVESEPSLVAWACGHTHYNFDIQVGNNVRVVSNQRGYKDNPNKDYERGGIVLDISI